MAKTYTIQKGDCVESVARKFGFGDFRIIYDHPNNAALKQKRPKPNLLVAGDELFIPDIELKDESGATEMRHSFELVTKKVKLRLVLKDDKDQPFADKQYELKVGNKEYTGSTDSTGYLEHEITPSAKTGELKLHTEDEKLKVLTWNLQIGALEPPDTTRGVQERLKNLGFYYGSASGRVGKRTKAAIKAFKKKKNMTVDENIDDELRGKLRDSHDKK